jgi:hypothetical protein
MWGSNVPWTGVLYSVLYSLNKTNFLNGCAHTYALYQRVSYPGSDFLNFAGLQKTSVWVDWYYCLTYACLRHNFYECYTHGRCFNEDKYNYYFESPRPICEEKDLSGYLYSTVKYYYLFTTDAQHTNFSVIKWPARKERHTGLSGMCGWE